MENKINIAELLKDCPSGMELDCAMYDNCTYEGIEDNGYIDILINTPSGRIRLTKEGCYIRHDDNAKCVIFPKNKTTWEGFVPPCEFKDGDIISNGRYVAIFHKTGKPENCVNSNVVYYHCWYNDDNAYYKFKAEMDFGIGLITKYKYATEEEKQKLFDAIKANGYKWNEETKTLEKLLNPRFKIGNRIKSKITQREYTIIDITKDSYIIRYKTDKVNYPILFCNENDFALIPNKFDITTLKPFEKVLVRDNVESIWFPCFFGGLSNNNNYPYSVIGGEIWKHCIPYEGNEHLLNKKDDCDEFYKTW